MATETLSNGIDELLNDRNPAQAWEIPLEAYLEEYSKRLQEALSADDGYSKLNFTEPAFIVSKAAKVWGRKVDNLDDFLHAILQRAISGNKEGEGSVGDISDVHNEDSNGPTQPENVPKKQKQKTAGWTLEDLRALTDIVRPVVPSESENIDLHKNPNDIELKNTLRPRINFDLHPVYRLPVSIQIKNISGDVMGDYCDFFSNTFDVEQVNKLLEGRTAGDRTLEMMDVDNEDDNDEVTIIAETDNLFSEPVKLESNSEPVMNLCPTLLAEEPPSQSTVAPNSQMPLSSQESALTSMPGLEPQSLWEPESKEMEVASNDVAVSRERTVRNRVATAVVTNKFMTRLDPYDTSAEEKKSKPLSKTLGKPYKLPTQKSGKDNAPITFKLAVDNKSDDIFSQHMPPLKPPAQMPASIADSVSVELSEQMVQKFNDNVLVACGRKSQPAGGRTRETESTEIVQINDEIPLSQEPINLDLENNDDEDSDMEEVEPPVLDLAGLTANGVEDQPPTGDQPAVELDALPDVQNLEDMVPPNVFDESRIRRVQDWDSYVESRLASVERTPFDVNEYCVKMVACGQQAGKKKWFSLQQTVMKMAKEKEHVENKTNDAAKLGLNVRREGARSLVSLLFLANSGNFEFRNKNSDLEVRLISETISRVNVDSHGIESPTHRVALTAQHQ